MKGWFFDRVTKMILVCVIGLQAPLNAQITILPLHQFELKASLQGNKVNLNWIAENEMNTKIFLVERSTDGVNYSSIATKPVSGPPNIPTEYQYQDEISGILSNPVIFYRIKTQDNDNRYGYSNVALVKLGKTSGVQAWPSPFVNKINISYYSSANTKINISVIDNLGRIVNLNEFQVIRGLNQVTLDRLEALSTGLYFIRITDLNTDEFLIQKMCK